MAHVLYRLDVGGLESILVELIRSMPRDAYRHVVICIADYTSFRERLPDDVPVYALNKPPGLGLGMFVRFWRLLRRLRPDVVHSNNLAALECQPVAALAGVPARVHAEHGWDVADLHGTNRKYQLMRRVLSRWVHRHVAVSADLAGYLRERAGVPAARVQHIYNGVNTWRFHPRRERDPDAPFVIGTVGRMQRVKDQVTLAHAFVQLQALVPERFPNLRLVCIGDGPEYEAVRRVLADAGVQGQAFLPGNRDDIAEQLRQMDLFALPSLAEGIPVTVLEAMATGLPVVASRVGGLPELVVEGQTGALVPPGDASALALILAAYVADPEAAAIQGRDARERAEQAFSLEAMVTQYADLYGELLQRRGSPSAAAQRN
ncbi:TIGR03088 family PEP-CTERM/XrtA system glycosyltransferase [Aquisalimonas asiatica]|uniref:TIGR03088 family PEP-CTERM/XrtA system glycosyltransferase n=1 Tax=Aquisalimonas asiatica TaxID=406100 RepID=UPI000B84E4C7|nr:TIGR03088 family PEP-CTERM/XrtA system glycosyltransferase [Aquisalimonas asiatica]